MIPRILEPEVMDSAEEAREYNEMAHSDVNRVFVDDLLQLMDGSTESALKHRECEPIRTLDVGTGTALIPIELASRADRVHVTGIDLSENMLRLGRQNVSKAGLAKRIDLELVDAKRLPFEDGTFEMVVSNSIAHHIPDPLEVFAEMCRVLRRGGLLFVRDLLRPTDTNRLEHLVNLYAEGASPRQRQLFGDSLHAALTLDEVAGMLAALGLPTRWVRQTSDRHWTVSGFRVG